MSRCPGCPRGWQGTGPAPRAVCCFDERRDGGLVVVDGAGHCRAELVASALPSPGNRRERRAAAREVVRLARKRLRALGVPGFALTAARDDA